MTNTQSSVAPPAKFKNIIHDLFQNKKQKNGTKSTFSKAKLTNDQQNSLVYPQGFVSNGVFLIYQNDFFDETGQLNTLLWIISFALKDEFIYGFQYNILNQERYDIKKLKKSRKGIKVSSQATFNFLNYIEVYHSIFNNKTVILSLSPEANNLYSSLQYSDNGKYFFSLLEANGIEGANSPPIFLLGLSKNLRKYR